MIDLFFKVCLEFFIKKEAVISHWHRPP